MRITAHNSRTHSACTQPRRYD